MRQILIIPNLESKMGQKKPKVLKTLGEEFF